MKRHEIFQHILALTPLSDDDLVRLALSRTGFQDNTGLGISYPAPDAPEEDAIPPCAVRATYWDNGKQSVIADERDYLEALVRHFLTRGKKENAAQVNDVILTLGGLPPQKMS